MSNLLLDLEWLQKGGKMAQRSTDGQDWSQTNLTLHNPILFFFLPNMVSLLSRWNSHCSLPNEDILTSFDDQLIIFVPDKTTNEFIPNLLLYNVKFFGGVKNIKASGKGIAHAGPVHTCQDYSYSCRILQPDLWYPLSSFHPTPCYKKSILGSKQPVSGIFFVAHNSARLNEIFWSQ